MQYLYMLRAGQVHYKVGIAANVSSRTHGLQLHNPELIQVVVSKLVDKPYDAEQEIHEKLKAMKANGANEWFTLTPEQALEVAIAVNKYPDMDVSEQVTLNGIVRQQRILLKSLDKKLDYILNTYQKDRLPRKLEPQVKIELPIKQPEPESKPMTNTEEKDEIFDMAVKVVREEQKASTSLLQRRLRIGYGRAARIIDMMYELDYITGPDGAYPRSVILENLPNVA